MDSISVKKGAAEEHQINLSLVSFKMIKSA